MFRKNNYKKTINLDDGTYNLKDIVDHLLQATENEKDDFDLEISYNHNTMKLLIFSTNSSIDFTYGNLCEVLGFSHQIIPPKHRAYSDKPITIFPVNMISIKCNLIMCNIQNKNRHDNTLHDFPLDCTPGEKIVERPSSISYFPIHTDEIHQLLVRVVDENDRLIDFRGEDICITLAFRPAGHLI